MELFFATNRNHEGADRWNPTGYGSKFSDDGMENLRFGKVVVDADTAKVADCLNTTGKYGTGNGIELADYLSGLVAMAVITPFPETIPDPKISEIHQPGTVVLGSKAMFAEIKSLMENKTDVILYIHGFNVTWGEAVGSALALQEMLNASAEKDPKQDVLVVLLTWPSDGQALPFVSYKSDRSDAKGSSGAIGRGLLKLRDFLQEFCKKTQNPCGQNIHLLCHSMGNYVLQEALQRVSDFSPGSSLPRIFENIFMCAPDVDDTVFETGNQMEHLPELARWITVYYNRQDKAMYVSDYTKGNPERLGCSGAAHPGLLHNKINQVDCTPIVVGEGLVEHSYYQVGLVNEDIRMSSDGVPFADPKRKRVNSSQLPNVWVMKG